MPTHCSDREPFILAYDRELCAHRKRRNGRQPNVGARKYDCAKSCHLVGGSWSTRAKRVGREPADVAVSLELPPSPAVLSRFIDHYALAQQRLGVEPSIMRRRAAHGSNRLDDLVARAFDKALGFDLPLQMPRRDLRPKGIHAGVKSNHCSRIALAK